MEDADYMSAASLQKKKPLPHQVLRIVCCRRQQSAMFSCKTHEFPQEASMFSMGISKLWWMLRWILLKKRLSLLLGHLDAVNLLC